MKNIILTITLGLFSPLLAIGLSIDCGENLLQREYKDAASIFIGKCINVEPNIIMNCTPEDKDCPNCIRVCSTTDSSLYTFKVEQVYKGLIIADTITIYHSSSILDIKTGNRYLLFRHHKRGRYGWCSNERTITHENEAETIKELSKVAKIHPSVFPKEDRQIQWSQRNSVMSFGAITFILFGFWLRQKQDDDDIIKK